MIVVLFIHETFMNMVMRLWLAENIECKRFGVIKISHSLVWNVCDAMLSFYITHKKNVFKILEPR